MADDSTEDDDDGHEQLKFNGTTLVTKSTIDPLKGIYIDRIVSVDSLVRAAVDGNCESREGVGLLGLLISAKHQSTSESKNMTVYWSNNQNRTRGNKATSYDRCYTFADLSSPAGKCFTVLCRTSKESKSFIHSTKDYDGVGDPYLIQEMTFQGDYLDKSHSIPIVDKGKGGLPLASLVMSDLVTVPLTVPAMGESEYFCLKGIRLDLRAACFAISTCEGFQCDQQYDFSEAASGQCVCFQALTKAPVVEVDVEMPCSTSYEVNGKARFLKFRSRRTSSLFVAKDAWGCLKDNRVSDMQVLRKAVKKITAYVNGHGGFTIVGWSRTGAVADAAKDDKKLDRGDMVTSDNRKPHISYLMPTENTPELRASLTALQVTALKITTKASAATQQIGAAVHAANGVIINVDAVAASHNNGGRRGPSGNVAFAAVARHQDEADGDSMNSNAP